LKFPGRTFEIRETYSHYAYHEEQEQYVERRACVTMFNAGDNLTMETRDKEAF